MDYASSGVDIDLEYKLEAVSSLIGSLANSVRKKGEIGAQFLCPEGLEESLSLGTLDWPWLPTESVQNCKLQIIWGG